MHIFVFVCYKCYNTIVYYSALIKFPVLNLGVCLLYQVVALITAESREIMTKKARAQLFHGQMGTK